MDLFGKKAAKQNELLSAQVKSLQSELSCANNKLSELGYDDYKQVQEAIKAGNITIAENVATVAELSQKIADLSQTAEKTEKQLTTATNKLKRSREVYKSVEYALNQFLSFSPSQNNCRLTSADSDDLDELSPSVILKLQAMNMKDLRKAYRDNDRQIENLLEQYSSRYTTKANQTIYKLMVIALRAELQNILYSLRYEKLDEAITQVKNMTAKYLSIASEGNQSIVGTMTKFIGQIEYLFINAVKIEYNYYVKKEQAKQEQAAIREKIRQEAAERKALEAERKKIEAEESKYQSEIARAKEKLLTASGDEVAVLTKHILEVESMLSDVTVKKDEIARLQNGKAGNIYIISNLGSFGDNVFKVGMTRRINPQDRVDELGDASVPFRFDVHSFIFSEDAVSLEAQLHQELNDRRVNKVNLRKEFFRVSIDELEALVDRIAPTAEFNRTMLAEEYHQSLSSSTVYTTDYEPEEDDEE